MTLQQLKYIITVSEEGSISKAANKLFISQPSLTNQIHEVENEFNRIKINDNMHYLKMDKNFKKWYTSSLKNKVQLNKFERIFSVKTINKYHKLLTICNHSTILLKNS